MGRREPAFGGECVWRAEVGRVVVGGVVGDADFDLGRERLVEGKREREVSLRLLG